MKLTRFTAQLESIFHLLFIIKSKILKTSAQQLLIFSKFFQNFLFLKQNKNSNKTFQTFFEVEILENIFFRYLLFFFIDSNQTVFDWGCFICFPFYSFYDPFSSLFLPNFLFFSPFLSPYSITFLPVQSSPSPTSLINSPSDIQRSLD